MGRGQGLTHRAKRIHKEKERMTGKRLGWRRQRRRELGRVLFKF